MTLMKGDEVIAVKDFGGIAREAIPAGARGRVESAGFLAPARVTFELDDFWRGRRTVTVDAYPEEIERIVRRLGQAVRLVVVGEDLFRLPDPADVAGELPAAVPLPGFLVVRDEGQQLA